MTLIVNLNLTGRAFVWMANLFARMFATVEQLATLIFAGKGGPACDVARNKLLFFAAVTLDANTDIAWRTGSWVTEHFAVSVFAVLVFGFVADVCAGVRQNQRVERGLLKLGAVAKVARHFVLGVGEVAVGAGPVEKGQKLLTRLLAQFSFLLFVFFCLVSCCLTHGLSFLFLLVFTNVLLQTRVYFVDPPFYAAQVERLATLLAIPQS